MKYAKRRNNGYVPKYRIKAGEKAFVTKITNLAFRDRIKYTRLISKLEVQNPKYWRRVMRKIRKRLRSKHIQQELFI